MRSLETIEKEWTRKKAAKFDVGDSVDVHVKIIEGDRERIQIFAGVVIAKRHEGLSETFTVRRLVQGEGVERIFPINSPRVVDIIVKKKGNVRRAKLHYLRDRVGRSTRVEEKLGAMEKEKEHAAVQAPVEKNPEAPKAEKKPEPAAPAK
ncbi:MAG TPA: 50S ribosomal protein L19 [Planctomycetota bacterium]|nr:50S ribosomal protein L19 [Planctomycetota bacterium]